MSLMITAKVQLLWTLDIINDNHDRKGFLKRLGFKIKQLRTEQDLSQADFGKEIDVEKSNVSRMESGRVNPRTYTLYKVAKALNISLSELLNFDE